MNKDLDKILLEKGIKFLPWIGEDYFDFSPRVLILGESHYFGEPKHKNIDEFNNDNNHSRDLVEGGCHPGLFKTYGMLTNKIIDNEYICDYICFYNFFQKCVGMTSKDKDFIDDESLEMSRKAFLNVIEILSPDLIIAWGVGDLYKKWVPQDNCEIIDEEKKIYKYKQYPKTVIWHMHHPSAPKFDYYDCTNTFKNDVCERLKFTYPIK